MTAPHAKNPLGSRDARLQKYNQLLERAKALIKGDDDALKELIDAAVAGALSDTQIESLVATAARAAGIKEKIANGFVKEAQEERRRKEEATPDAREEKRRRAEAEAKAAKITREAEIERLRRSCSAIAMSKTLLADMERLVHRMGLVGEGAAIRGTYIAGTSRLLRRIAISFLRRGAPASGKNIQINKVLFLFPREAVIVISSATPQALIYEGEDENDVNALKHKIIAIGEAAVLARKANGDEHPMVPMLRTMLADGHLDHSIPLPQGTGATPKTIHIRRDGPMCLMLTSARDNIEDEMMTRLLCSDADESGFQTKRVVLAAWRSEPKKAVAADELQRWVDFQKWLELDAPPDGYEVIIPFAMAIANAHLKLLKQQRAALQLRVRRDTTAFRAAIEASAVIHKADREADAPGRIIATLEDYEQAHNAFDAGMAALYGIKQSGAIKAALRAVIAVAGEQDATGAAQLGVSYKITLAALRHKLGFASNRTVLNRLESLVDLGVIEEDEEKHGRGKGSPHHYRIKKWEIDSTGLGNVFPTRADVEALLQPAETTEPSEESSEGEGGGRAPRAPKGQPIDIADVSWSSQYRSEKHQERSDEPNRTKKQKLLGAFRSKGGLTKGRQ
jgi:hypothetical protein